MACLRKPKPSDEEDDVRDGIPVQAERVATIARAAMARSTFLAGFTYYECGRYGFAKFAPDEAYISLMTFALVFSIIAAVLSSYLVYYLDRAESPMAKKAFAVSADMFVRMCYVSYILALWCYCLGLSRCGYVYYKDTNWRWAPPVYGFFTMMYILASTIFIMRQAAAVEAGDDDSGRKHNKRSLRGIYEHHGKVYDFITTQSDVVTGRATYIIGFAQSGVTRYLTTDHPAGNVYLLIVCAACNLAVIVATLMTVVGVALANARRSQREALAIRLMPLGQRMFVAYLVAFSSMMLGIMLMGWGCGYPNDAYYTMGSGIAGIVLLIAGLVKVSQSNVHAREAHLDGSHPFLLSMDDKMAAKLSKNFLTTINLCGGQATISSGFTFYNIVTYKTDILMKREMGEFWPDQLFLLINALTVVTGIVAAVYDSLLTMWHNDLRDPKARALFVHSCRPMVAVCQGMFELSMLLFMVGLYLYCPVKYNVHRWAPAIGCIAGIVLLVLGRLAFYYRYRMTMANKALFGTDEHAAISAGRKSLTMENDDESVRTFVTQRGHQWTRMASVAMFFGGFAYFALVFFNDDHVDANVYVTCCTSAFVSAIVIVTWANYFNRNVASFDGLAAKIYYVSGLCLFYYFSLFLMCVCVISFLLSFAFIGFIKPDFDARYYKCMIIGATMGMTGIVVMSTYINYQQKKALRVPSSALEHDDDYQYNRIISQLSTAAGQAGFVAGNVFFELLFAVTGPSTYANYWYFGFASATLAFGCIVVATAGLIPQRLDDIPEEARRIYFMRKLRRMKSIIFFIQTLSLWSWMASVVAMGSVKYDAWWYWSFYAGLVGAVVIFVGPGLLKMQSNEIKLLDKRWNAVGSQALLGGQGIQGEGGPALVVDESDSVAEHDAGAYIPPDTPPPAAETTTTSATAAAAATTTGAATTEGGQQ